MEADKYISESSFREDFPSPETVCSAFDVKDHFKSFPEFFSHSGTFSKFFLETLCSVYGVKKPITSLAEFNGKTSTAETTFVNDSPDKCSCRDTNEIGGNAGSTVPSIKSMKSNANKLAASMISVRKTSVEKEVPRNNSTSGTRNSNLNGLINVNSESGDSCKTDFLASIIEEMDSNKIMKKMKVSLFGTSKATAVENKNLSFQREERKISRGNLGAATYSESFDKKMSKSVISQNELPEKEKYFIKNCECCQIKSPTNKENEKLCLCSNETRGKWEAAISNENYVKSKEEKVKKMVKSDRRRGNESNIRSRAKKAMLKREFDRLESVPTNKKGYHHMKSFDPPEQNIVYFPEAKYKASLSFSHGDRE